MTLSQIKAQIKKGNRVFWSNYNYEVIQDKYGQYLVVCRNGYTTGLTDANGKLVDDEKDFYSVNKKHLKD